MKTGEVIAFLNGIIYYMVPIQNAVTSPILYDTITKCNNIAYFQRTIFIYVLYYSWVIEIYVLKNNGKKNYVNAYYNVIDDLKLSTISSKWRFYLWYI